VTVGKIDITTTLGDVETFLKEDKSMTPAMRVMINLLVVIIHALLSKLGLNSTNSSLPPSRDPNRTRGAKKNSEDKKRKPGAQPGHVGSTLTKEPNPDIIEPIEIDRRTIPHGDYTSAGYEARQVIDIEIYKQVTEYRAEILQDAQGNRFIADFPNGVSRPVQYGTSVKAQAVYMSQQQLIPYERVRDYFTDQCGIPISTGTLVHFNEEAFDALEKFEEIVVQKLVKQEVLHADETGMNVNGKLMWLHSVSNQQWTLFFPHAKRGGEAMKAMGILEHFGGTLCHDHWKPYFEFSCLHSLCNAHHLRELEYALEHDGQQWAKAMTELLLATNKAVYEHGGCLPEEMFKNAIDRYRSILIEGNKECPAPDAQARIGKRGRIPKTKSRNLLERLRDYETETLRFMTDKNVPFTNNQGENDIRMTKVQQKISGCFRAFKGAEVFCRIRSYLSTCGKQGMRATEALKTLFEGRLPSFIVE
jgi:transposase